MNVPEALLRLGCTLVAWMVVFTHLLWLALLDVTGCDADGDQLWRLLLGFALFTIVFAWLLNATRPIPAVHSILRWFAVPAALLSLLAWPPIWDALIAVSIGGGSFCADAPAAAWHFWWAPVQIATLGFVAWGGWRAFRKPL